MKPRRAGIATRFLFLVSGCPFLFPAQGFAADYYACKIIELVVGSDAGGGYDIYARALARPLPRHIPGSPTITVKNMPGAGSSRAGVFVSTVAPKDGTSMAALMP